MAATMPGLKTCGLRMERPGAVGDKAVDTGAPGGRSKCMSGRQSARTRRRVDKSDNSWGHAASRKIHPRAERGRLPVSEAGCRNKQPRPCRSLALKGSGSPVPLQRRRAPWSSMAYRRPWRRGRGETPGVPHAPMGGQGTGMTGKPEPEWKRGDLVCSIVIATPKAEAIQRAPAGAQEKPLSWRAPRALDRFASRVGGRGRRELRANL